MRTLVLLVVVALALPASAQELETRRSKLDDLAAQLKECRLLEREFGVGGDCLRKTKEQLREIMRKINYPILCEAYRGGRWIGVTCWDD